ncbi:MAG: hypothetical protein KUG74_10710 [Rhodobacteraceae bacterium]|nr:hypothetical protein [Paracoccaceae bacterium]
MGACCRNRWADPPEYAGYDAGFKAGIKGDLVIPSANPITAEVEPDFQLTFAAGAALGFEQGHERKEDLERRAHAQTDERELE